MSGQSDKDNEAEGRVSPSMQPAAAFAAAPFNISNLLQKPSSASTSPTMNVPGGGSGGIMSQVEKDEATKRRMSAARTERMETVAAVLRRPFTPPTHHTHEIKASSSTSSSPGSMPPTPDRLIVPASISGDREATVKFPKSRPVYTPPRSPSPYTANSSGSSMNVNNASNHKRRPSLPQMPTTKAGLRITPKIITPDGPGITAVKRPSLPLIPVTLHESDSQHRRLPMGNGEGKHKGMLPPHRLSLAEALDVRMQTNGYVTATPASTPEKHVLKHRVGVKKQRVSLPPQASQLHSQQHMILTESFESTGSAALSGTASPTPNYRFGDKKQRATLPSKTTSPSQQVLLSESFDSIGACSLPPMSSSPARKHRLGDRKQRVSLPPQAASPSQQMSLTDSFDSIGAHSLPAMSSSPGRKHRLGHGKKQRVSLPSQSSPTLTTPSQQPPPARLSLPLSIRLEAFPFPLPKKEVPEGHKKFLGEKKSQRLSLPNASVFLPALSNSSSDEEQAVPNNSFDSAITARRSSTSPGMPQKGLRNNSIHRRVPSLNGNIPDISGPGAYFVPGDLVANDADFANFENDIEVGISDERPTFEKPPEDEEIHVSADFTAQVEEDEFQVSPAFSTIQEEEEHYISSRSALVTRPPSPSSSDESSLGRHCSAAISVESSGTGEEVKTGRLRLYAIWCALLVLLILAGSTVAVVLVIVNGHDEATSPAPIETLPPQTLPPLVDLFENGTVPDFTVAAWEDPDSAQSKAKDWLRADPNVGNYSQNQRLQRFALATLFYSTNGLRWKNSTNWLSYDHHECFWFSSLPSSTEAETEISDTTHNVTSGTINPSSICNEDREYEYLILASASMRGPLPPELSLLTSLVQINLSSNRLSGELPSEIGTLSYLADLSLPGNELEATLPKELGRLSSLKRLDVRQNKFAGSLPPLLAGLSVLEVLFVSNNLLNSTIPTLLGKLTELKTLELSDNKIIGTIPSELGLCRQLSVLGFGGNQLKERLPTEIWSLTNLTTLRLEKNSLNYTLSTELGLFSDLKTLIAFSSGLRGTIGTELGSLTKLGALDLGNNILQHTIPTELGSLTNLEGLNLNGNQVTGFMPSEVGNLRRLKVLNAFQTAIRGNLPSEIGHLTLLEELQVFETLMSGEMPTEIGSLSKLKVLNLGDTSISGTIPTATCALVSSMQLTFKADCQRANLLCCNEK